MNPPLPRVITVAGAIRLGLRPGQIRTEVRHGRWRRLASGIVLTRPDDPTRTDWINAGLALAGPDAALRGWDAVRLRGVGPRQPPVEPVLVLTASGRNRTVGGVHLRPSRRPVRVTVLSELDEQLPGARIATPARAVCDTALDCREFPPVRAMVTAAVQKALCTPDELIAEFLAGPRNSSGHLIRALEDVAHGAHSIAEAEALGFLRSVRIPPFEVNAPILDATGHVVFSADILWRELRAILEIDSREFHFAETGWKATMRRHNALAALGYAVTHYPPSAIRNGGRAWALEVAAWLESRACAVA